MEETGSAQPSSKEEECLTPAEQWRRYMDLKKSKLLHQINAQDMKKPISAIFEGVSIYVNGYTDPPASELRRLIQMHGGEFHIYYEYGTTTYTIATHVAGGKVSKLRKNEKVIHPRWIIDCIEAGERLPEEGYLVYKNNERSGALSKFTERDEIILNAATDPNFISNFYERSRLHLISTLAQEMKQYVLELRSGPASDFISRHRLGHLICEHFEGPPKETICHVDLDCFFVSVALRTRPELIGKPVAVTHSTGSDAGAGMSEVASCSYEARACGVRNGCYVKQAKSVCPNLICLPYQFEDYRAISRLIYTIISRYTLDIRAVSCDEMYVDLNSLCTQLRIMDVMGVVTTIREEIRAETGCNASVGVGPSMLIARLSTRHAKPNGQFIVTCERVDEVMKKEKIFDLPGIGYNIRAKLKQSFGEMELCEQLQAVQMNQLQKLLGAKMGIQIYNLCRGVDKDREFLEKTVRKSISCDINYGIRFNKESEMFNFLNAMAVELEKKLYNAHMAVSTITLKVMIRAADAPMEPEKYMGHGVCDTVTRSAHLLKPATSGSVVFNEVKKLMQSINPVVSDLRGIGIQLTRLSELQGQPHTHRGRHTLVDFFAVRTKGTHAINRRMKHLSDEDDPILRRVLKESLREEANRKIRLIMYGDHKLMKPYYHSYVEDMEVKAEMCRVLERFPEPTKEETQLLTTYFWRLAEYGNWSEMTDIVPVVVPKTKEERDKVKDRYVEDINDQYAYLDFRLLIPSCMFAALSVLVLLWAISLSYYFDAERFRTNNITAWLNVTEWAERACNMTFNDIPEHWLPSVLRIFELSVQGNVLFRIAAIVPIAIRLFHSYITKATNTLEKANNNPIYRLCNTAAPYLLLAELSSCALFSIITIRFDFPEFHRTAMFAFVISGTLHMLAHTATSLWKVTNDQKAIDQLSSAVKVVSFIGFGFAAPQFLNFQQKFIDFPNCHSYVPPFHAICEYLMFICNGGFHLTTLIDNRHARLVCYPRTASGECEPLKPANFRPGGRFEYCRSWELAQRQAQLKHNALNKNSVTAHV